MPRFMFLAFEYFLTPKVIYLDVLPGEDIRVLNGPDAYVSHRSVQVCMRTELPVRRNILGEYIFFPYLFRGFLSLPVCSLLERGERVFFGLTSLRGSLSCLQDLLTPTVATELTAGSSNISKRIWRYTIRISYKEFRCK